MTVQSTRLSTGEEVLYRNGTILAVLNENDSPIPLRESGFANTTLMAAVEKVCQEQGWPEWAIKQLMDGVMHGRNMGLYGKILPWDEARKDF